MSFSGLFNSDREWFWRLLKIVAHIIAPFGMRNNITILIYHQVLPVKDNLRQDCINREEFDQQMRIISKLFNVVTIEEAARYIEQGNIPPRTIVITFDDGYSDNYHEALPILKKYGLPAIFYVVGDAVRSGALWNDTVFEIIKATRQPEIDLSELGLGKYPFLSDRDKQNVMNLLIENLKTLMPEEQKNRINTLKVITGNVSLTTRNMLTKDELISLSEEKGMTIGTHTMRHPMMSYIGITDAQSDVIEGKEYIESIINKPIRHFSYPYGKYGENFHAEHLNMIASLGFKTAVTTNWGAVNKNSSRYFLQRFTPWDRDPLRFFLRICWNFNKS
ncbi:polysaccharide deacetylase family protein [Sedimenticola hydrogenitrophicus]|uniref:polysaccharide deacetylase family protein n=1 Tax=Sedimenticola hydrogenitrophicus TaxID=2967975 RepID=UPI0023AF63DC|nr:polysaccharide deacetylase family protein [Sedimenticola hydrogenitrophicus]